MPTIDLTKPIISERDPIKGEVYCIECFGPKSGAYMYFYNGHGPLCCKQCYADYVGVKFEELPNMEFRANVK